MHGGGDGTSESELHLKTRVRRLSGLPGHRTGENLPVGLRDGALDSTPALRQERGEAPQTIPLQTARILVDGLQI